MQKSQIPEGWIFMFYVNLMRYPLFFMMGNEMADLTFSCPNNSGAILVPTNQTVACTKRQANFLSRFPRRRCSACAHAAHCMVWCAVCDLVLLLSGPTPDPASLYCFRPTCPTTSGQQVLTRFDVDYTQLSSYYGTVRHVAGLLPHCPVLRRSLLRRTMAIVFSGSASTSSVLELAKPSMCFILFDALDLFLA